MRVLASVAAATLLVGASGTARADPVVARSVPIHRVGATFEWDPIWAVGLRYDRGLPFLIRGHDARVGVRYASPVATWATFQTWRWTAEWTMAFWLPRTLGITTHAETGVVHTRDVTGTKTGWSAELGLGPGTYWPWWSLGLDLRWRGVPVAGFRHSDVVAETFDDRYPDGHGNDEGPRDGPRAWTSQRVLCGLFVGGNVLGRVGLFARGGLSWQPQRQGRLSHPAIGQLPFYVQLGVDGRW